MASTTTYLQDNNLDKDEVTFTGYYVPPELPELELSGFDYLTSAKYDAEGDTVGYIYENTATGERVLVGASDRKMLEEVESDSSMSLLAYRWYTDLVEENVDYDNMWSDSYRSGASYSPLILMLPLARAILDGVQLVYDTTDSEYYDGASYSPLILMLPLARAILDGVQLVYDTTDSEYYDTPLEGILALSWGLGLPTRVEFMPNSHNVHEYDASVVASVVFSGMYGGKYRSSDGLIYCSESKIKTILEDKGYCVGGIYLLAPRNDGRQLTQSQDYRDREFSRAPSTKESVKLVKLVSMEDKFIRFQIFPFMFTLADSTMLYRDLSAESRAPSTKESVKLVKLVSMEDKFIRFQIFPFMFTLADSTMLYRDLSAESRANSKHLLSKSVDDTREETFHYNDICVEGDLVIETASHVLGKLDKFSLTPTVSVWLTEDENPDVEHYVPETFDPLGYSVSRVLTEPEYVKTLFKQRGYTDIDWTMFDNMYDTRDEWFMREVDMPLVGSLDFELDRTDGTSSEMSDEEYEELRFEF